MNAPKLAKHLLLITAYSWVYIGCYSEVTLKPENHQRYRLDEITITTPGRVFYELETPWVMDTLGNITGRGTYGREIQTLSRVHRTQQPYEGTIPADSIASVEVLDGGKTFALIFGVLGITMAAILIYAGSGAMVQSK